MALVTVDLPAHNVWPRYVVGQPLSTRIGGTDCLAVQGDGQGMQLTAAEMGFLVGASESVFHPGYADGSGDALGFGLFALPEAATLVDCRFVAVMQVSGTGTVPDGTFAPGELDPIPVEFPVLAADYSGMTPTFGYTLTVNHPVGSPINHLIDDADYVIAGIGEPDTGENGLCPLFVSLDLGDWSMPGWSDYQVLVDYLAIRVTYELTSTPGIPPRRQFPRDDGRGVGNGRIYPPPTSLQHGRRTGGATYL